MTILRPARENFANLAADKGPTPCANDSLDQRGRNDNGRPHC
jgi:hypothetical protein